MYPNLQIIVKWISCYHIPLLCGPFSSTWKADCILLDSRTNTISDGETYNRLRICFLFDWYSMNRFLIVKKCFHHRSATNVRQLTCHRAIFVILVCKRSTCDVIMFTPQGLKTMNLFLVSLMVFKSYIKKVHWYWDWDHRLHWLWLQRGHFVSGLLTLGDRSESVSFSSQISSLK